MHATVKYLSPSHAVVTIDSSNLNYWEARYDAPVVYSALAFVLLGGIVLGFWVGRWRRAAR